MRGSRQAGRAKGGKCWEISRLTVTQNPKPLEFRFLCAGDFDRLHRTFVAAFSDYTVNMNVTQGRFRDRLARDGVQLELSVGAFAGQEMIGFCINGIGLWQGQPTAYDAGTAIVPNYRGQGLAKELFACVLPRLKEAGMDQYLLEVITTNTPAVNLYHQLGFSETRTFAVYKQTEPLKELSSRNAIELRAVDNLNWELNQLFWDGQPSWQNSIEAIDRTRTGNHSVSAYLRNQCVGYGVLSKSTGNVVQLAVARDQRRKSIGSLILNVLQSYLPAGEMLKVTNVDRKLVGTSKFYEANGFKLVLEQLEMVRSL